MLRGVLPRVLREIRGAPGSAPESAQCGTSTERALSGALPEAPPICLSTLGSTPRSTPISRSTLGSTSESSFKDFPLYHACDWWMGLQLWAHMTPVGGRGGLDPQWCNTTVFYSNLGVGEAMLASYGSSQTRLFSTWLFAIFALFCALLRSFADLRFALVCALLRSFARTCIFLRPTTFRTTASGNFIFLHGQRRHKAEEASPETTLQEPSKHHPRWGHGTSQCCPPRPVLHAVGGRGYVVGYILGGDILLLLDCVVFFLKRSPQTL